MTFTKNATTPPIFSTAYFDLKIIKGVVMLTKFLNEEEGAQVVEYALIIAVISISLVLALQPVTLGASFDNFIDRVSSCLAAASVCI